MFDPMPDKSVCTNLSMLGAGDELGGIEGNTEDPCGAPAPYPDIVDCTPGIVDCAPRVGARFDPMLDKFGCINLSMPGAGGELGGIEGNTEDADGAPAPYCVNVGAVLNALVEPTSLASAV